MESRQLKRTEDLVMGNVSPPPEGWRKRVMKDDQRIGYITRRMEDQRGTSLSVSDIRDVLRYSSDYDNESSS